jgi:hypothetical protein
MSASEKSRLTLSCGRFFLPMASASAAPETQMRSAATESVPLKSIQTLESTRITCPSASRPSPLPAALSAQAPKRFLLPQPKQGAQAQLHDLALGPQTRGAQGVVHELVVDDDVRSHDV